MDQAPPLGSVGRFFLSAPLFLTLGGWALAGAQNSIFQVFVSSHLAGVLHFLTLGFLSMVMMGALLQMLPVIAGVKINRVVPFARAIHVSYVSGVLMFVWLFYRQESAYLGVAFSLLALSIIVYIVVVFSRLMTVKHVDAGVIGMRYALASFFVVALLGLMMGLSRIGWEMSFSEPAPMMLHYAWAAGGWVLLLIAGVSYRVVPMFFVAADYPQWMTRWFVRAVFVMLLLYSFSGLLPEGVRRAAQVVVLAGVNLSALLFALVTLQRIMTRKRKLPDHTLRFWKLAAFFVTLSVLTWGVSYLFPGWQSARLPIFWGFFALAGGAASMVIAMAYKIVPFLSWFHLASRGIFTAPTIKSFISDIQIQVQFWLHLSSLVLTLAAMWSAPWFLVPAGIAWMASGLFMFFSFARSLALYRKLMNQAQASGNIL